MEFVKLDLKVLVELHQRGYNVLRSNSSLAEENPTWIPDTIDLDKFLDLDSEQVAKLSVPFDEKHFLIIDQALKYIKDEEFFGVVMVDFTPHIP
ncbi:hypothetical protein [Sphingobacterium hungaricum]|uniref:Uncharacterized protein n=1 Tax=Sphingobacterium hungaricum TaxID=2082723 RepID=A0A928YQ18_9SPHI|nr:hypothetical protein [Sphingobacterium hungaricum]MBE8712515.1 hypothetical protein [Sphingobacterium hungaricum]